MGSLRRFGIVAEGPSDFAIVSSILKGALGIDVATQVVRFVPELEMDETDLHNRERAFSNWEIVKNECVNRVHIDPWISNSIEDEEHYVVIHIDSAECLQPGFDVKRPTGTDAAIRLRQSVLDQLKSWLGGPASERAAFAIAVEETDAWLLAHYDDRAPDTTKFPNPKERWQKHWSGDFAEKDRKKISQMKALQKGEYFAKPLKKRRELDAAATRNSSLKSFVDELDRLAAAAVEVSTTR